MNVNPTCVGMNRFDAAAGKSRHGKPHMCGDEPAFAFVSNNVSQVNPTCVGMNRHGLPVKRMHRRKPHMRGDEPVILMGRFARDP